MIEKKYTTSPELLQSKERIQLLIGTSSRQAILEKIRHIRPLAHKILQGFDTPQGQLRNWNIIEKKLVRQALEDIGVIALLIATWLRINDSFFERIKKEIHEETIEGDVTTVLSSLANLEKDRDLLLCGLLLDAREPIQKALGNGLQEDLMNTHSPIFINAERYKLKAELANKSEQILSLQSEIDELKEIRKELLTVQAANQELERSKLQLESQHKDEIKRRDSLLQEVKNERDTLQENLDVMGLEAHTLQVAFESEQAHRKELQAQMDELKRSLDTVIAYQQENASDIKRQLNETVQQLENERKESGRLRQNEATWQISIKRAEREKSEAYEKRDEERSRREHLETLLERTERAKEATIDQARKRNVEAERLRTELHITQRTLEQKERALQDPVSFDRLDYRSWVKAIDSISVNIALSLSKKETMISAADKWADWQSWQRIETTLVEPLLVFTQSSEATKLADLESAQKLLALRWYLLEWLKLIIVGEIRTHSRILPEI